MTIRKTKRDDHEVLDSDGRASMLNYIVGPNGFRVIIMFLVVSMHPLGRQILGTFGFEFPDQRKLTVATDKAAEAKNEVSQIASDVKDLKSDVQAIKANNAIINAKVDALDQTFHGFQIDFTKYQQQIKPN